jgi:acyl-CoA reductase-like NAD-dependent aldehyde dehydrogenase
MKVAYSDDGPRSSETKDGFFLPAAMIDSPPEDLRLGVEEQFGPIMPLLKWADEDDVLLPANASLTGLGGSIWSADREQAKRTARRLENGAVWVNSHFEVGPTSRVRRP